LRPPNRTLHIDSTVLSTASPRPTVAFRRTAARAPLAAFSKHVGSENPATVPPGSATPESRAALSPGSTVSVPSKHERNLFTLVSEGDPIALDANDSKIVENVALLDHPSAQDRHLLVARDDDPLDIGLSALELDAHPSASEPAVRALEDHVRDLAELLVGSLHLADDGLHLGMDLLDARIVAVLEDIPHVLEHLLEPVVVVLEPDSGDLDLDVGQLLGDQAELLLDLRHGDATALVERALEAQIGVHGLLFILKPHVVLDPVRELLRLVEELGLLLFRESARVEARIRRRRTSVRLLERVRERIEAQSPIRLEALEL